MTEKPKDIYARLDAAMALCDEMMRAISETTGQQPTAPVAGKTDQPQQRRLN